jgi:hypothetical protein
VISAANVDVEKAPKNENALHDRVRPILLMIMSSRAARPPAAGD